MKSIIIVSIIFSIIAIIGVITIAILKIKQRKCNIPFLILIWILLYGTTIFLACFPDDKMSKDYFLGITQMLGGLFTVIGVYLTLIEEGKMREKENQQAFKQLKEQVRLDHIALLKYNITYKFTPRDSENVIHDIDPSASIKKSIPLNIGIHNTGLGSAFNLSYQIIFGTKNEYSRKPIVSLIEPNEIYHEVMTISIPCIDKNYDKKITIIIYYEDVYGNNYLQKLEGLAYSSFSIIDGVEEIKSELSVSSYKKAIQIESDYIYIVPKEEIEAEQQEKKLKELEERLDKIVSKKDQEKVEKIISDYLSKIKYLSTIVEETLEGIPFYGGSELVINYEKIRNKTYLVTYLEGVFGEKEPIIYCRSVFKVNIKSEEIVLISREIDKKKSVLNNKHYRILKRTLQKDIKKIKSQDNKYNIQ